MREKIIGVKATRLVGGIIADSKSGLRDVVVGAFASPFFPTSHRWRLYRVLGLKVYKVGIAPYVFFGSRRISIGPSTFINYGCFFDGSASIRIGEKCNIGYQVMFATSSHELGGATRRAGTAIANPILVGDGVWIGARAVVLGGVSVGEGTIVAAGAVVVDDCDANSIYAGIPARKVRSLDL